MNEAFDDESGFYGPFSLSRQVSGPWVLYTEDADPIRAVLGDEAPPAGPVWTLILQRLVQQANLPLRVILDLDELDVALVSSIELEPLQQLGHEIMVVYEDRETFANLVREAAADEELTASQEWPDDEG